jgi:hypothetical protein
MVLPIERRRPPPPLLLEQPQESLRNLSSMILDASELAVFFRSYQATLLASTRNPTACTSC